MALPHGDVPVLQAAGRTDGRVHAPHKRGGELVVVLARIFAVFLHRSRGGRLAAEVAALVVFDGFLVSVEGEFVAVLGILARQQFRGDGLDVLDLLVAEWIIDQAAAERQAQGAVFQDRGFFDGDVTADGGPFPEIVADRIGDRNQFLVPCGPCLHREQEGQGKKERKEGVFHIV